MAMEKPLSQNMRTSFGMSPIVAICAGEMFRSLDRVHFVSATYNWGSNASKGHSCRRAWASSTVPLGLFPELGDARPQRPLRGIVAIEVLSRAKKSRDEIGSLKSPPPSLRVKWKDFPVSPLSI